MAIEYTIDRNAGLILTRASGTLTDAELLTFKRQLTSDPDFRPGMKELSDVRNVQRFEVTSHGITCLVGQDQADGPKILGHRLAIVATDDAIFGMARMYQALTEKTMQNVRVFRDVGQAKAWLVSATSA